jgi:hypothetical protein
MTISSTKDNGMDTNMHKHPQCMPNGFSLFCAIAAKAMSERLIIKEN